MDKIALVVPDDMSDPDVKEVMSWDRDGDGKLAYGEVRAAAVALMEARARARAWRRGAMSMSLALVAILGVIFAVAFSANETTKELSSHSATQEDVDVEGASARSASGIPIGVELTKAVGPSLLDIASLSTKELQGLSRITIPITTQPGDDLTVKVVGFRRTRYEPKPEFTENVADANDTSKNVTHFAMNGVTEVSLDLSGGAVFRVRTDGSAELYEAMSEQVIMVFSRGPWDDEAEAHDVVIETGEGVLFGADELLAATMNASLSTSSASKRVSVWSSKMRNAIFDASQPIHHLAHLDVPSTIPLRSFWHGSDDIDWHVRFNHHWHRRCVVYDTRTGRMHHFVDGLASARNHANPLARSLVSQQFGPSDNASVTFTRFPPRARSEITTLAWPNDLPGDYPMPLSVCKEKSEALAEDRARCPPGADKMKHRGCAIGAIPPTAKYDHRHYILANHYFKGGCDAYKKYIHEKFEECSAQGETIFERETCKREATRAACRRHCTEYGYALIDYHPEPYRICQTLCVPKSRKSVERGTLLYGSDDTVVDVMPYLGSKYSKGITVIPEEGKLSNDPNNVGNITLKPLPTLTGIDLLAAAPVATMTETRCEPICQLVKTLDPMTTDLDFNALVLECNACAVAKAAHNTCRTRCWSARLPSPFCLQNCELKFCNAVMKHDAKVPGIEQNKVRPKVCYWKKNIPPYRRKRMEQHYDIEERDGLICFRDKGGAFFEVSTWYSSAEYKVGYCRRMFGPDVVRLVMDGGKVCHRTGKYNAKILG